MEAGGGWRKWCRGGLEDGMLRWKEEGEKEELCFGGHRHLYSSLICDGVRKEVRRGHGAAAGL